MAKSQDSFSDVALQYCKDVLSCKIVACQWVKLACKRHINDLEKKDWPYVWDEWHADDACDFIEKLPHIKGEWVTDTIKLEPAQVFIVASLFGWRKKSDNNRRFDTAYVEVGRKNAKSTLAAGIALYCFTCEGENGPDIQIAATTGAQARIVFDVAKKMINKTPDLAEAFDLEVFADSIICLPNSGSIKPINAKASTQDGLNPHCSIIDELHAHKDRALFDVLKSARGARKNPLSFYITTAGYNLVGVCYEQRTLVTKILQNVFEGDHYFGIIYTLDEGDDPFDEKVWIKSNPLYGVSVSKTEMMSFSREAKVSIQSAGEFKTKRCNLWLKSAMSWLNMDNWNACENKELELSQFENCEAYIGVDLASKNDIAALAIVFFHDQYVTAFVKNYLPKELVDELAHRTGAHYAEWAEQGYLTLTPGNIIDYNYIESDIKIWCELFQVQTIAFDPYQATQIATNLIDDGHDVVMYGNTVKNMSEPAKQLEAMVNAKTFQHNGDPVLRWMASNVVVYKDEKENILPKKENKHSDNKIDDIIAIIMAKGVGLSDHDSGTIYDERELYIV